MPVWHEIAREWVKQGKLAILGVTQEQHPERCRLFAQWKQFEWPILHDPINVLGLNAVPVLLAIDEHGIVRSTRPNPKRFENEFLNKTFSNDAGQSVDSLTPSHPPALAELRAKAERGKAASTYRTLGDALALWGGESQLPAAIAAYRSALDRDAKDGASWFRLGVCLRRRFETGMRQQDDFRAAIEAWGKALELDPNQYIWRRRIEQYGPRLDKPYPFYDWVENAEKDIRARGETPILLPVRPDGAEIAQPSKTFITEKEVPKNPDPDGKINRDGGSVASEVVVVPSEVRAGQSARVHLTFRLIPSSRDHWNNEAEPLRVWVDPPAGVSISERLISADRPKTATSREVRTVGFELQLPKGASGTIRIPIYALYHLCEDAEGQCRFLRHDAIVEFKIKQD